MSVWSPLSPAPRPAAREPRRRCRASERVRLLAQSGASCEVAVVGPLRDRSSACSPTLAKSAQAPRRPCALRSMTPLFAGRPSASAMAPGLRAAALPAGLSSQVLATVLGDVAERRDRAARSRLCDRLARGERMFWGVGFARAPLFLQWKLLISCPRRAPAVFSASGALALRHVPAVGRRARLRHVGDEVAARVKTRGADDTGQDEGRADGAPVQVDDRES